jgi:hypothetical protein
MNPKILTALGILSFGAAAVMFQVGSTNGHLTELKDFFWVPIPLGIVLVLLGLKKKSG